MKYLQKEKKKSWAVVLISIVLLVVCGVLIWLIAGGSGDPEDPSVSDQNVMEQTNPTGEQTEPTGEQTEPTGEQTNSTGEQTNPTGEQTNPTGEQTEPTGEQTNPTGEQTNPTGGQTEPTGDQTEPTGGQTEPTGEQTEPTEEQTKPTEEQTKPTEGPTEPAETTQPTQPELTLPYVLENGKLTVDAFFQFTGMNPDCGDEYVEDVAAIQLTNASAEHMESVSIQVVTTEGVTVSFVAYDIPIGGSAIVVCPNNTVIKGNPECMTITAKAKFLPQAPLSANDIEISVEGTEITVKNISGKAMSKITVYCHSMLDESCFGGSVYSYEIDSLPAGETAVINALECYLGMVEVVRIEIGSD